MPTLPYESIFQLIEPGCDGETVKTMSMESTVLNIHYVIHSIGFHVTLMRPDSSECVGPGMFPHVCDVKDRK